MWEVYFGDWILNKILVKYASWLGKFGSGLIAGTWIGAKTATNKGYGVIGEWELSSSLRVFGVINFGCFG